MAQKTRNLTTKLPTRMSVITAPRRVLQIGRNDSCPCGSGKKYKDCHVNEGEAFLARIAMETERQKAREKREDLKAAGVPWYKRIFV